MNSSLSLFEPTPVDISVEESTTPEILPLSGVTNDAAIEFVLPPESSHYLDLNKIKLYIHIEVLNVKEDAKIAADDTVSLIPLWPSALFKEVAISLGQKVISTSTNIYPVRAFMEKFLSYSDANKKETLTALEHFQETKLKKDAGILEAYVPLHVDICQQEKFLLNQLEVRIRLIRNEDNYVLWKKKEGDKENYKIIIRKLSLFIDKHKPLASLLLQNSQLLSKQNAIYPIKRVWMKTYTLQKGIQSQVLQNIYMGVLPKKIIMGMVKSSAFNGDVKSNPFHFEHFHVNELTLDIDGRQVPTVSYTPNFSKGHVRREYYHLLESILGGCVDRDTIGLSLEDYISGGRTFFGFPLNSYNTHGMVFTPKQTGNVNLRLRFEKELTENVSVCVYAEFENELEVNSSRIVFPDFTI